MLPHLLRKRLRLFLRPEQAPVIQPSRPQSIAQPHRLAGMGPQIPQIPTHGPGPNMIPSLASSLVCHRNLHAPSTYSTRDRTRSIYLNQTSFHPPAAQPQTLRPTQPADTARRSRSSSPLSYFLLPTSHFLTYCYPHTRHRSHPHPVWALHQPFQQPPHRRP
jgi:hypothetical protein